MVREIKQEGQGFLVEFSSLITTTIPVQGTISRKIQGVLDQFQQVFNMPEGLPPFRGNDHAIRLVNEGVPVNIRPYRYPHLQKNEIERMVRDMLAAGIIQPSISPILSSVLLVKKKDGSWHFVSITGLSIELLYLTGSPFPQSMSSWMSFMGQWCSPSLT